MGKLEFFELGNSEDKTTESRYRSSRGCFVKLTTGAILLLLTLILAVGVGLIVHFVERDNYECSHEDSKKPLVCAPAAQTGNGNGSPDTPIPTSGYSVEDLSSRCKDWASTNSAKICSSCPTQTLRCPSTRAPPTTTRNHITTIAPPVMKPSSMTNIRLPRNLSPLQYDIEIKPNMYDQNPSAFTFDGHVRIKIQCNSVTNAIVMHGKKLDIDQSSITVWDEDASEVIKFTELIEDKQRQFLTFKVDKQLVRNNIYYLEMKYSGPLQTDLAGLYLSSYQQNGQTQYLATTQFQPNDARKAFPCFDEPDFKAVFNITLIRKPGWTSLSNAKLYTSLERNDGYVADNFYLTKKMSSYLVAFVVSRFAHNEGHTSRGIPYRTWSQPDAQSQAVEALNLGTKIISYYEDLFNITFPLQKQDMIAVPDYPLGGMENWGLITYRESAMLYNPGVSSEYRKQRVTRVIAHELSHMWFGDLVTTAWWDDLWLNEGFATYMEYVGSNFSHPDWKMFDQFTVSDVFDAFEFDGLRTSHPIYVPVNSPDEIGEIFDKISYSKGGSVIRMMKHFLGADTFSRGLTRYLRSHEYDVARHDDLFQTLQAQLRDEGKSLPYTVKDIMDTWILQMNYPVVMITRGDNSKLGITQKRFLLNPDSNEKDRFNSSLGYVWKIPFTYTTSVERDFDKKSISWMNSKTIEITDPVLPSSNEIDSWVLGNPGQYGFYRVNYERSNWLALTSQLKQDHTVIHVVNRAQLINDAWNLARAGETGMDIALQTVEYLDKEKDYVPWSAAKRELKYLDLMLSKSDVYGEFQAFMKSRVEPLYNDIGLDNSKSTHLEILLRSEIVDTACSYGVESCKTAAKNLYSQWMKTPHKNPIHPDLQSAVYCTAIAEGGWDEWNFAFDRYRESKVASEIALLMSVLACTEQQWILRHYLDLSMDSNMVRSQDMLTVIEQVSSNAAGKLMAWDFTMENWDYLRQKFGGAWNSFSRLVEYNTNSFNTEHEYNLLSKFVRSHPDLGTSNRAFFQAIETTETNIKFMKNNYDVIKAWLHDITSSASSMSVEKNVRLPRSVIPELYEIEIQPNMYDDDVNKFNFTGHVTIHVNCRVSTSNITLHANKLTINHNTVIVAETMARHRRADDYISVTEITTDTELQFVIVHLDKNLTPGRKYTLYMEFSGPLKNDLKGLYLSSYKRAGKDVYLATTQMEATDARKAFPCFDEPDLKAKFKLTLIRKSNLLSLSNMPIERNEPRSDGFTADIFQVSRTMSSYLVAFVVCDFNSGISKMTRNNITYSVWARKESENQLDLALDTGADTITFYEDFFGVKFPLPKQDMIAIPDFASGAMENWGLITYRENSMLYKEGKSSTHDKQWTTETITHELAHQWFGDLVTMSWWDDLWLNEGFATFVQYLGADHKHPDWKMFDQFTVTEVQVAFEFDGLISSHPIYTPVSDPAKINEFFDKISYSKGGSIIRMMRHFIGEETFKKGIRNYLQTLQYSNAFHDDLWMAMENQTRIDGHQMNVKSIMDTWTLQMNYPVVKFERLSNGSFTVTQKRYLRNYDAEDPGIFSSKFEYHWKIPLTFTTQKEKHFEQDYRNVHMFESDTATMTANSSLTQGDWIIGNVQQYGYYRVNYDEGIWEALIKQLNNDHTAIHTINRGQLINDAWALAKSGDLTLQIALQTTQYLSKEQDYVPWYAASTELSYVDTMLGRTPIYGHFKKYMAGVSGGALELLGMDNENSNHITRLARSTVVEVACSFDVAECTQKATEQFASYMQRPNSYMIDPDIKKTAMCAGISHGGKAEWDFLYNIFKKSNVANERLMIMSALSCSAKTWILRRYLELSLDPDEIKSQDASYVIRYVAGNVIGRELAWEFLQEKWDIYMERYGAVPFSLSNIISGVTESFNAKLNLQQLKAFKELHPNMGTGARAFDQAIEKTAANIGWMDDNYANIGNWLYNVISESSGDRKTLQDVRLPRSVIPSYYELEIQPYMYDDDVNNFNFTGKVTIRVSCKTSTDNITLHAKKLSIYHDKISVKEHVTNNTLGKEHVITFIEYDTERQFVILHLRDNLRENKEYDVYMEFSGPLTDDMAGFYLSSYKRGDEDVFMATTQMEATAARKAFPCFDEPDLKARFKITLIRKSSLISLSNMKIESTRRLGGGLEADVYKVSEKMSTYLVAFVICDFSQGITRVTKNGITYGAWARPETGNQTQFALDVGVQTLDYYEDFFSVAFPLKKQDMIAVPDFAAGAMENWGLIMYKEDDMLYQEDISSSEDKMDVVTTITHELAHQWFGNLVTMEWWDDLWLNEGFATFVQYLGADHLFPEWDIFQEFSVTEVQGAFEFDSHMSSHPVYVPVYNADEIDEIFDAISYSKGGAILRMMRHFVGESTFKKGLKRYLLNQAYGNAVHNDLWYAVGNQTSADGHQVDVKGIMDTWTLQMNYPVIKMERLENGSVLVTQSRYLQNPEATDPGHFTSKYGYVWKIPVTYTTKEESNFDQDRRTVVMMDTVTQVIRPRSGPLTTDDWIIGNVKQYGYYRVNYCESIWRALIKQLNSDHKVIYAVNRGQLINDAWALAKSGNIPISIALDTSQYLSQEEDYVPWSTADKELSYVDSMLTRTSLYGKFQQYMSMIAEGAFSKLGMDNTNADYLSRRARSIVVSIACEYGIKECEREATRLFSEWMRMPDENVIDPDIKSAVLCAGIRNGGVEEWDFLYNRFQKSNVANEKTMILSALSCSRTTWILKRYLEISLDPNEIKKQDADGVISYVSENVIGQDLAWSFLQEKWNVYKERYESESFPDIIKDVTKRFNTDLELNMLISFKEAHPDMGSGTRAFEQAIENTEANLRWMDKNYDVIETWLNDVTNWASSDETLRDVKLPRSLIPELYDLELFPDIYGLDPNNFMFSGHVKITFTCTEPTNNITLHIYKLNVHPSSVKIARAISRSGTAPTFVKFSEDKARQFLIIHLSGNLIKGTKYYVYMEFSAPLTDDLKGLYLSTYKDGDNTIYMATTHMEPVDARKAFPCFDEPDMKARFKVTLVRRPSVKSLSNMPLEITRTRQNGLVADVYKVSEKMSTYLLAFIVGNFENITKVTTHNISYGAWSIPQAINQTSLALRTGMETLTFYEDFFSTKFPLPKQDMIAIPDFSSGAMENWGLITYRETNMLFKEGISSESNRQRVVEVITHELAHQWFGNLVTMSWWDDLWLNEGFATFVQYLGADHIFPEWKMFEQFTVNELQEALDFDGLTTSHPLYAKVYNPMQIREIFDSISYSKGAMVIRMMRFFLGNSVFKAGLETYLRSKAFGNAFHDDLWFSMGNALQTGPTVPENGWVIANLQQTGYYRVNYEEENWKAIISQLKTNHKVISPSNRAQLINDAWALTKSEDLNTTIALQSLEYLKKEVDYVPWSTAKQELTYIKAMLSRTSSYGNFKAFIRNLVEKPFTKLGMKITGSSHLESFATSTVASVACSYDNSKCLEESTKLFREWMAAPGSNPITPDMKQTVYCAALKQGGKDEWDFLYKQYKTTHVAAEKKTILEALSCTRKLWLLHKYLDLSLNADEIRKQDSDYVMIYVSRNSAGRDMVWNFFQEHWDRIYHDYGQSTFAMKNIIKEITASFNSEFDLLQLQNFKTSHNDLGSGETAMEQALESTEANIRWMDRNYGIIESWLQTVTGPLSAKTKFLKDVRLPRAVIPDLYNLEIFPDFYTGSPDNFTFYGYVKIYIHCVEKTNNVTLHINKLTIDESSIRVESLSNQHVKDSSLVRTSEDKDRQFYILHLDSNLQSGVNYSVEMNFTGPLKDDMAGLYLSTYKASGKNVFMATTQMEATDARKAFPCFDEPNLKAKFQITLVRRSQYKSLSNMPQKKTGEKRPNGLVADVYEESPIMSTYLVAMVVCNFEKTSLVTKNNITLERTDQARKAKIEILTKATLSLGQDLKERFGIHSERSRIPYSAWATPETVNQTAFALDVGITTITFYEDFFGIKFPLPKQDMIAIPDFSAGAMENWGLITYRETAMLYEPGVSSEANKQRVTTVITHELAHQWFGNLVTMDWWDDLWLNEGFADFVEHFGADHKFPKWNYFAIFVVDEMMEAFDFDGLTTSHPMFVPVYNPAEISEVFDSISYAKGASVVRMMRFFVGEGNFRQGLHNYLYNRMYRNAKHNDLWFAMQNQTATVGNNVPVKDIMDTWTLQMNYPVVSLRRLQTGHIRASQKRFLINPKAKDPKIYISEFGYTWKVPLTFVKGSNPDFNKTNKDIIWLNAKQNDTGVTVASDDWYLANSQLYGYYRVNYEQENWKKLVQQLKTNHMIIHIINRAQLINDAWNLAKAGELDIMTALNTTEYLRKEMEYVPWRTALRELSYVSGMLSRSALFGKFTNQMKSLIEEPFNRVGLNTSDKDTHLQSMLRIELSSYACTFGVETCIQKSKSLFKSWMADPVNSRINPDIKSAVYCTAIREGGVREWDFLHKQYQTTNNAAEKKRILNSLSCSKQIWLLGKYLEMSLDSNEVRKQDAAYVMTYVSENSIGQDLAWNFVRSHWGTLMEDYGGGSFSFGSLIKSVTSNFNTEYDLQQMHQFKENNPDMGSATRAFEQALEKVQSNIDWMEQNYDVIDAWLDSKQTSSNVEHA